jgi:CubicO group peptidase (beta-lactamase class C family)
MTWWLFALFLLTLASASAQPPMLDGFDTFVERQLKEWNVPGAAVVVVNRSGVLLSKGYGQRDIRNRKAVTSKTIFAIASATKPFTAAGLATLVVEGKLDWDKPVREYLPNFRLYDSYATEHITLRDLLTHRSGLPRYEGLWFGSSYSTGDIVRRLRFLEPSAGFRAVFQYSNMNFTVAGHLQGKVDGDRTWEESEKRRVIDPLGMTATSFSVDVLRNTADYALPYAEDEKGLAEVPFFDFKAVAPAGTINSNADDMGRFLRWLVDRGKFSGRRLISEKLMDEMQSAQMLIPWELDDPLIGQATYGLGWFVTTYRGHPLVYHWGSAWGVSTIVALLPKEGIGAVVLANRGGTPLSDILCYNLWDRALGVAPEDWPGKFKRKRERRKKTVESKSDIAVKEGTRPSHSLAAYAGEYEHPGYGTITIGAGNDGLTMTFNNFTVKLKPFNHDVFQGVEAHLNPMSGQKLQFRLDVNGAVDAVLWDVEAGVPRGVFIRKRP